MKRDTTKLRHALHNPASGYNALINMRSLLIDALDEWPQFRYQIADHLLPWGQLINPRSRMQINTLLSYINANRIQGRSETEDFIEMCSGLLSSP
jgi:hypothetical protein